MTIEELMELQRRRLSPESECWTEDSRAEQANDTRRSEFAMKKASGIRSSDGYDEQDYELFDGGCTLGILGWFALVALSAGVLFVGWQALCALSGRIHP
jgi:hypothetical protein